MSHFPGHIRAAFCDWLDAGQPDTASVEVNYEPQDWPAERLLGRLTHCSDILPGDACDQLDIARGSSYASAAQRLLRERRRALDDARP